MLLKNHSPVSVFGRNVLINDWETVVQNWNICKLMPNMNNWR